MRKRSRRKHRNSDVCLFLVWSQLRCLRPKLIRLPLKNTPQNILLLLVIFLLHMCGGVLRGAPKAAKHCRWLLSSFFKAAAAASSSSLTSIFGVVPGLYWMGERTLDVLGYLRNLFVCMSASSTHINLWWKHVKCRELRTHTHTQWTSRNGCHLVFINGKCDSNGLSMLPNLNLDQFNQ